MTAKLYRVRITSEVFVVAESREDAEDFALRDQDVVDDLVENGMAFATVAGTKGLSEDEKKCLPWVHDDLEDDEVDRDLTVGAWAELNDEAAAQAKREAEFKAKQLILPGTEP
jgi:hypothetical protein